MVLAEVPDFDSQHPHGSLQHSLTPFSGIQYLLLTSTGITHTHITVHIYTCKLIYIYNVYIYNLKKGRTGGVGVPFVCVLFSLVNE